jgi:hypothetical protein
MGLMEIFMGDWMDKNCEHDKPRTEAVNTCQSAGISFCNISLGCHFPVDLNFVINLERISL